MKANQKSNDRAAMAAVTAVTMCFAMSILTPAAHAQYGERYWTLPMEGTYFSLRLGGTNGPPLPFMPFDPTQVPVYLVPGTTNQFIYDDTAVSSGTLAGGLQADDDVPPAPGGGSGGDDTGWTNQNNGPLYGSNDLWLQILAPSDPVPLVLHGTKVGLYQLLSTNSLSSHAAWQLGEIVEDFDGTNEIVFNPVPMYGQPKTFFRAVSGATVASVFIWPLMPILLEPTSPGGTGDVGFFVVQIDPPLTTDVSLVYSLSGSATPGLDYTSLPGTLTIPAGETTANIYVQALYDPKIDFDESVVLTLILTNGYLVSPDLPSATITIRDNIDPAVLWSLVSITNFPADMDYHSPTNSLIVSANVGADGQPRNFFRLDSNGVPHAWTGVSNLTDEVKIATVKVTSNGFRAGDMFFSTDVPGVIGWASADGSNWNKSWITLPGETNHIRGSLYVDQTGIWSNNLLAVSGEGTSVRGGTMNVWRIDSNTNATLITNIFTPHLEGLLTLPNDARYGPWAGKLITGDEYTVDGSGNPQPRIYAVDTNGHVTSFALGVVPSDIDLIPTNQNLYCTDPNYNDPANGRIFKIFHSFLTNYLGDVLFTGAGEDTGTYAGGKLAIVRWDQATINFVIVTIPPPPNTIWSGLFEHSTFSSVDLPPINP